MAVFPRMALAPGAAILAFVPTDAFWQLQCEDSLAIIASIHEESWLAKRAFLEVALASISHSPFSRLSSVSALHSKSTSSDLLWSNCTSCQINQDLFAYWAPPLYFVRAHGMKKMCGLPMAPLSSSGSKLPDWKDWVV